MPNPWVIVGALALVIGAFLSGYRTGVQVTKADWEAEKATAAIEAGKVLAAQQAKVTQFEHLLANTQNKVEKVYVDKVRTVEVERNSLSATARNYGLFIDTACPDSSNALSGTASSASSDHGTQKARLSGATADALIAFAANADEIASQLTACQEILRNERELPRSP
jgi:hypothetical protein